MWEVYPDQILKVFAYKLLMYQFADHL